MSGYPINNEFPKALIKSDFPSYKAPITNILFAFLN